MNKKEDLKGYGTVWFYPEGFTNILSLGSVKKKHRVTYDSTLDEGFLVFKADRTAQSLGPSKRDCSSLMLRVTSLTHLLTQ